MRILNFLLVLILLSGVGCFYDDPPINEELKEITLEDQKIIYLAIVAKQSEIKEGEGAKYPQSYTDISKAFYVSENQVYLILLRGVSEKWLDNYYR